MQKKKTDGEREITSLVLRQCNKIIECFYFIIASKKPHSLFLPLAYKRVSHSRQGSTLNA